MKRLMATAVLVALGLAISALVLAATADSPTLKVFGTHFGPDAHPDPVSGGWPCSTPPLTQIRPYRNAALVLTSGETHCPAAMKSVTIVAQLYKFASGATWVQKGSSSFTFFSPCVGCTVRRYAQATCNTNQGNKTWAAYIQMIAFPKSGGTGTWTAWSSSVSLPCS